ncbi:MAG TPA: tRNA (adenosine(37)-N6)-threonylcarbamoyltransferase complex ATPase subunit type 1 TsaE [Rhizomicrobium sp.]|nr:tRNA (adenosine(37)-N6)-threonylcarbamoyltransferase complex ATPase subunit type 1 TsaE [Rhizomicrobium sp.]
MADLRATGELGAAIARMLAPGDCVALEGDLGAGKTTLARAILEALGVDELVPSPSFTLVQMYETARMPVHHFDLYRIETASELDETGLDEALNEGVVFIEWPERAGARLPHDTLHIALSIMGDTVRQAHIFGPAKWSILFAGEVCDGS